MESSERGLEDVDKKGRTSRYHKTNKRGRPTIAESSNIPKLFKCGCGKDYSTNGALFSHTRIKHGGVQPPGSTRMRNNNRKPRKDCGISRKIKTEKGGRRREGGIMMSTWEVDLLALLNSTVGGRDQSLERSVSDMIVLFKTQMPPLPDVPEAQKLKNHFLQVQGELATCIEGGIAHQELEEETASDIFERDLLRITDHFKKMDWRLHIYLTTVLFIYSVSRFASLSFLAEIIALFSIFLNFVNTEGGQEVEKQILKKNSDKVVADYCLTHDSEYIPELASAFMKYRYVSKISQYGNFDEKGSACNLFGKTASHLLRVMHLFNLWISWLNTHQLSNCEWQIEGLPKLDHPFLLEPQPPAGKENDVLQQLRGDRHEDESVYIEDSESEDEETHASKSAPQPEVPRPKVESPSKIEAEELEDSQTDEAGEEEMLELGSADWNPKTEQHPEELTQYLALAENSAPIGPVKKQHDPDQSFELPFD